MLSHCAEILSGDARGLERHLGFDDAYGPGVEVVDEG
jgi:hypothetical protein